VALLCSYEALAGEPEVTDLDVIHAIRTNADENVVRFEITVNNIQAVLY
jgi:hypothetical protein